MESKWGSITTAQVLEFYNTLDKTNLDKNTKILIEKLLNDVKHYNDITRDGLIMFAVGLPMFFMPYITSNDSDPQNITFPDWAGYTCIAGFTINCVAFGMLITQNYFNIDSLLEAIAISYNKNYLSQQSF